MRLDDQAVVNVWIWSKMGGIRFSCRIKKISELHMAKH